MLCNNFISLLSFVTGRMQLYFSLLLVLGCALTQAQDLDSLIGEVFSKPNGDATTSTPNLQPNAGGDDSLPGVGDCVCVPYYLCNNGSINTNGEGIIDIR